MKRITLLTAVLTVFVFSNNLHAQQILSQSVDQTVIESGVRCAGPQPSQYTGENNYWRSYVLADFGITSDFEIGGVQFGVGEATANAFDVTVTVYLNSGGAFPGGTKTSLATTTFTVAASDLGTLVYADFDTPVTVPASSEIVVQLHAPSLETELQFFSIGLNDLGETAPSYISSVGCQIPVPTTFADIGYPDNHIILNLVEEGALGVENETLTQISMYPNPVEDQLNITLPSSVELQSATMFDLLGQATSMRISEDHTLNTASLADGVYILKLETSQGILTKKIIKE